MGKKNKKKWIVIPLVVAVLAAGIGAAGSLKRGRAVTRSGTEAWELTTIKRGSIESVVSSSGTLSPISEVSVLPQMSGRVEKVYADYNQVVRKGEVLAQINTDMLKLQEMESEAAVKKAQANYDLYDLAYQNNQNLFKKSLLSEYDLKSSETSLAVCAAELSAAQAALKVIQTELNQYALITSPINGIVIDKNVDVGQSVVEGSSANATSLFTISEDLSKMEIKAEVDELDISSIKVGQDVHFTVEARPGVTYTGKVNQIRLVPKTTDNVVNYYVMITTPNKGGSLFPGMTASIEFVKQKRADVPLAPSAAFRFQPASLTAAQIGKMQFLAGLDRLPADERAAAEKAYDAQVKSAGQAAGKAQAKTGGLAGMMMPGPPPTSSGASSGSGEAASGLSAQNRKPLWYVGDDGELAVRIVEVGVNDGTNTELVGADDLVGKRIILREKTE